MNTHKEHLKLLVCPDCKGNLKQIEIKNLLVFFCERCQIIYPIKENIPILLAKEARNYDLEYPLITKIEKKLSNNSFSQLHKYIKRTLDLLMSKKGEVTWEWEDEKFWSREYAKDRIMKLQRNWNNRIWQIEKIVKELTDRLSLRNKTILSVGCGEGQTFRFLLSKYCNEKSLYIATDISFEALKLNRSRNTHKNSLYVLCSADCELPFPNNTVDVLCYFAIIHHTKNKSDNISKDRRLVKRNRYIIIAFEPFQRSRARRLVWSKLKPKSEGSAHEEHIRKENLFAQLTSEKGFKVCSVREERTPFYNGMMTFFCNVMLHNKKLHNFILNLDNLIARTLGCLLPFFRAGEILVLVRRR